MDAGVAPASGFCARPGFALRAVALASPLLVCLVAYAAQPGGSGRAPVADAPGSPLLPRGDGTRDLNNPDWSADPTDPFPMPPELASVELMKQTPAEAR